MNSRKKKIIILDVETTGKQEVFDLAIVVGDLYGNILVAQQWIIEETYKEKIFWEEKRVDYERILADPTHPAKLVSAKVALEELTNIITKYNVKTVYAYNASFDTRTTENLANRFNLYNPLNEVEIDCLWFWSAQTIFLQKNFIKWADKNFQYAITDKGNYKTSAEIAYAYLKNEPHFEEVHRGLEDCFIEYEIFLACRKQRKIRTKGICSNAWIIPQPQAQIDKLPKQFQTIKLNLESQLEKTREIASRLGTSLKVEIEVV